MPINKHVSAYRGWCRLWGRSYWRGLGPDGNAAVA